MCSFTATLCATGCEYYANASACQSACDGQVDACQASCCAETGQLADLRTKLPQIEEAGREQDHASTEKKEPKRPRRLVDDDNGERSLFEA